MEWQYLILLDRSCVNFQAYTYVNKNYVSFLTGQDRHIVSSNQHTTPKISRLFSQAFPQNAEVNMEFQYNVSLSTALLKVHATDWNHMEVKHVESFNSSKPGEWVNGYFNANVNAGDQVRTYYV